MTMNLTIAAVVTALLAVVSVGFLYLLGARTKRRAVVATVRFWVQMAIVGACAYGVLRVDRLWLNIVWLLLMVGIAAWYSTLRARLRSQSMVFVVWASMFVALVVGLLPLYCLGPVHQAALLVPLSGGLLFIMTETLPLVLREYFVALERFSDTYYYQIGNGASWLQAVIPMLRRAVDRALLPVWRRLSLSAMVGLPLLLSGLLLSGQPVVEAVVTTMLLVFSGIVATLLAIVAVVLASRRRVTDKRGRLTGSVRRSASKD